MTTNAPVHPTTDRADSVHSGRIRLVAAALAAASATLAALVLTHPWGERLDSSADEILSYDLIVENHANAWPAMLVDVFAFGVIAVCLAIGVAHLVRGRGRTVATVGAVLVVAGGILSAMGSFAFATVIYFAGNLPEGPGLELVDIANDDVAHLLGVEMAGFLLFTLGSLVLAGALVRSMAVPRLFVALFVLLTIGLFAGLSGAAMDSVQAAQVLLAGGLAVPLWRSAAPGGSGTNIEVRAAYSA
jgi:hypothetical protein